MKVVGAGFGRTGTLSTKVALEKLGFGPCYHMFEVMRHPEHVPAWVRATRGGAVDWAALFAGWGACVDWPACSFWEPILAAHPDAKVLLTVRDPERWYQSCVDTIRKPSTVFPMRVVLRLLPPMRPATLMATELIWERTFGGRFEDKATAIAIYNAHNEAVKRAVPPERLLVWQPADGWAPLCAFLGVPVPDEPFPHVNDSRSQQRMLSALNAFSWLVLLSPLLLAAGLWAWLSG